MALSDYTFLTEKTRAFTRYHFTVGAITYPNWYVEKFPRVVQKEIESRLEVERTEEDLIGTSFDGEIARSRVNYPEIVNGFYASAITGFRAWRIYPPTERLHSLGRLIRWDPERPLRAGCAAGSHNGKEAPLKGCTCGIYALRSLHFLKHYAGYSVGQYDVWGEVYLWGRIHHGIHGWRAEYAYPKNLCRLNPTQYTRDDAELAQKIADAFGVPLHFYEHFPK